MSLAAQIQWFFLHHPILATGIAYALGATQSALVLTWFKERKGN